MRHLRAVSVATTVLGLALVAVALILDLPATWILVGLLLAWAGVVKVVVVVLWRGFFAGNASERSLDNDG